MMMMMLMMIMLLLLLMMLLTLLLLHLLHLLRRHEGGYPRGDMHGRGSYSGVVRVAGGVHVHRMRDGSSAYGLRGRQIILL